MPTPLQLMKAKEDEDNSLYKRQDFDKNLIYNTDFIMEDADGFEVPRVFNVTLPNASIFFAKMVSLISGVTRQPIIEAAKEPDGSEGKMTDEEKAYIIDFLQDMDYEIDTLHNNQGKQDAFTAHSSYFCARGWSAEQVLLRMEEGKFIADVRYLDRRWLSYDTSRQGLEWFGYSMTRSKLDIEKEFEKWNVVVGGKTGKVRDFYDKEDHYVYVDNREIIKEENPYKIDGEGYVPSVIRPVSYGPMLEEEDSIKWKGESIFYPHRAMFKEMNWMASIIKTQSFEDLRSALQQTGDKGADTPEEYPTADSIIATDNPLLLIPKRGLTNAMRNYQGLITSIQQRAGLSAIDEGTIAFPMSAVAFARVMAQKQSLILPRHQALGQLYSARTKMIIAQAIEIGGTLEIGQEGQKRKYDTSKLKGSYTVSWRYFVDSLEDRATRQAIANAEVGLISRRTIRKNTLQLENPEQEENFMEIEEAKRKEPLLADLERIHSLIDEDTDESDVQAWILYHKVTTILRQRQTGGIAEPAALPQPKPTQQIPVFGGGGGGGGGSSPPAQEAEGGEQG